MSSKRKFPGIEEDKENPLTKPIKKVLQEPNLFSFFKSSQSKSKSSVAKVTDNDNVIQEKKDNESVPLKTAEQNTKISDLLEPKTMIIKSSKKTEMPLPPTPQEIKDFRKLDLPEFLSIKKASYKTSELSNQISEEPQKNCLKKTFWSTGAFSQAFPYFLISESLDAVSKQKGEKSVQYKKQILENLFTEAILQSPSELFILYNFLTCRFDADFRQKDINIGNETILKVVAKLAGKTLKFIREELKKVGDLGTLSESSRAGQKTISTFFFSKKTRDVNMKVTLFHCFSELQKLADIRNTPIFSSNTKRGTSPWKSKRPN